MSREADERAYHPAEDAEKLAQSRKMQAVGQLAAGIAHDFNNLLTVIIGAADAIVARGAGSAETQADLIEIRDSAERGAALVRQLLAFGRQQALQPRLIEINRALETGTALLKRLLGTAVTLRLDLCGADLFAIVDPNQFDQVLINLAVNARDAMSPGGTLTLRSGHIDLFRPLVRGAETIAPGSYVVVEVEDTGHGIPPDIAARIFEPFFTTRAARGGTGLGLSTVYGIVRQSGGYIGVESAPGQGTRMRVYIPRSPAPSPAPVLDQEGASAPPESGALPVEAPSPAAAMPRVLLVEDEDGVRRLAARALSAAGWIVSEADCAEAVLTAVDDPPDLLISDVVMPGMDGAALASHFRARWPALPVLLVSGYVDESLRRAIAAPGVDLLAKPYGLHDLTSRAEELRRG